MEREEIMESRQSRSKQVSPIVYLVPMILLGLVLSAVIIYQSGRLTTNILPSSADTDKVFSSKQDGFSVQSPVGWNALSEEGLGKYKGAFSFAAEHEVPKAFFGVKVQKIKPNTANLDQIASGLDKAMTEQFESVGNQRREIIKLNGHDALKYEFTFVSESKKMRQQIVLIPSGSKVYHLSATALDKDYDSLRAGFDKLIEGFTVSD